MLINNKNQNNNSIDYIISFDFLKFKEYISNTKSIIRILNKEYNSPSINIIFYNIKLNHLADQFFLDFLKFKDEILLEKNISIFCTNERNILEANNNIICKKKLLNTKKHIFLLHPNFIFKKIFKNKIDTIIQDLENNKEINWVNFSINPKGRIGDDVVGVAIDNIVTTMGDAIVAVMGGIFLGGNSLIVIFMIILAGNTILIQQISRLKNGIK
jgi:hypothetical protein